jgi:hypothetical protein
MIASATLHRFIVAHLHDPLLAKPLLAPVLESDCSCCLSAGFALTLTAARAAGNVLDSTEAAIFYALPRPG